MDALLYARSCRFILVGDIDQLPSARPGQIFRDLIESGLNMRSLFGRSL